MEKHTITREDLQVGISVEINPQNDKTRAKIVSGKIKEILTTGNTHPHGILVLLESGEKGRVRALQDTSGIIVSSDTAVIDDTILDIATLVNGENHTVEFKDRALWSINLTPEDIKNYQPQSKELHKYGKATSKYIIAKTLAAFLNTDGGTLLIGIAENKEGDDETIGIEAELQLLRDKTIDGYRRMLVDIFKDHYSSQIFNHLNNYLRISFQEFEGKQVCLVRANRADQRVFVEAKNEELFFIRTDASSREINGSAILDYCDKRFK